MGSISLREYIRWLPGEAEEPTSTVVVTSPKRHFVDIRVLRSDTPTGDAHPGKISVDRLDWAIAGTSSSWPVSHKGRTVTRGRWTHWIDSRTRDTDNLADEGDMTTQPDGSTLETGRMLNPDTGRETDYEEVWRDVDPRPTGGHGGARCVVLRLDGGRDVRGLVVLARHYCQGFSRRGDSISAERWEWTRDGGWARTVAIGENDALPCYGILDADGVAEGDTVKTGASDEWMVIEAVVF